MKKYFTGDAFNKQEKTEIEILIIAANIEAAKVRYQECVARHQELEIQKDPKIAEFWGDWDLVKKENESELRTYFSTPIYI